MHLLIIVCVIIILAAFVTLHNDLKILRQMQLHSAIANSRFLWLMDIIFDRFFAWKIWRILLPALMLAVILLTGSAYLYVRYELPNIPPVQDIIIDHSDSTLLKRGEYLANHVAICTDCHSPRDINYFSWPIIKGEVGAGGPFLSHKLGYDFPGESFVPNITPANLGSWSDGEIYRLITTGIDKDGNTINHAMPFQSFAQADPADLKAIIAYLRTLKPISNKPAGVTSIYFFHSLYNRTIPREAKPIYLSTLKTAIDTGHYLVTIANCNECHTPKTWLEITDTSRILSGGVEFPMPTGGFVHTANLTPDESGIGDWTEEAFINKFKSFRDSGAIFKVKPNTLNSLMPWKSYSYLSDNDLHAIYSYLKSIRPIYNPVTKFTRQSLKSKVN